MKLAFRADAFSSLGTGHAMRCLAFGQAIKATAKFYSLHIARVGDLSNGLENRASTFTRLERRGPSKNLWLFLRQKNLTGLFSMNIISTAVIKSSDIIILDSNNV